MLPDFLSSALINGRHTTVVVKTAARTDSHPGVDDMGRVGYSWIDLNYSSSSLFGSWCFFS